MFLEGFKEHVYHEGDQLVLIHSHELPLPAMPRKYNTFYAYNIRLYCDGVEGDLVWGERGVLQKDGVGEAILGGMAEKEVV